MDVQFNSGFFRLGDFFLNVQPSAALISCWYHCVDTTVLCFLSMPHRKKHHFETSYISLFTSPLITGGIAYLIS